MPRQTQALIAQTVGVDAAQVSRALRGSPGVAKPTRDKILRCAKELGYRLDPGLSALAEARWKGGRRRRQGIALLFPQATSREDWLQTNPRVHAFRRRVAQQATAAGYRFESLYYRDFKDDRALSSYLDQHQIGGLIIAFHPDPVAMELPWERLCTVIIGAEVHLPGHHRIMTDYHHIIHLATQQARVAGCQRIAYACFRYGNHSLEDAVLAPMLVQQMHLMRDNLPRLELFQFREHDLEACRHWYTKQQPDCIIGTHNQPYYWLQQSGIHFPKDCSFISLLGLGRPEEPKLSCVDRRHPALATEALALLDHLMRHGQHGPARFPITQLIAGEWRAGVSLR